ncbi:MAG: SWIM zinc finger family protein [Thermodesulfovibrionia bacterium]|nr:SWIM zinc finger family protein [Thermodesulfovibrionia bacterium]
MLFRWAIHSTSDPDTKYMISVDLDPPRVYCDCPGYQFNGYCKHIKFYKKRIAHHLKQQP